MDLSITPSVSRFKPLALALLILAGLAVECGQAKAAGVEKAYFAGGCFWCIESDFEKVSGVKEVISGFTGGTVTNPTYRQVVGGGTGHYEAVEIQYDPDTVTYENLLFAFFRSVDPTDPGGQFCDRGESYRTAIFVETPEERQAAETAKTRAERELGRNVVTPILDASAFYPADGYHQDYYKQDDVILTRRGPKTKADAYKFYRNACGRDERVKELWGDAALFAG